MVMMLLIVGELKSWLKYRVMFVWVLDMKYSECLIDKVINEEILVW